MARSARHSSPSCAACSRGRCGSSRDDEMMRAVVVAFGTLLVTKTDMDLSGPFKGLEHARRRPHIENVWAGLPKPAEHGATSGVVALRMPLERRVRIPGGTFPMGSRPTEMELALVLCEKELLGTRCREHET